MDHVTYHVFKGTPQKSALWVGSVKGLEAALDQMNRLAERLPNDYFVLDGSTNEVLATARHVPIQQIHVVQPDQRRPSAG